MHLSQQSAERKLSYIQNSYIDTFAVIYKYVYGYRVKHLILSFHGDFSTT